MTPKPSQQCPPHLHQQAEVRDVGPSPKSKGAVAPHASQGAPADDNVDEPPRRYLSAPQVQQRYSISDVTLYRWLDDERLGFPQPAMRIRQRRFWLEADLRRWEWSRVPRGQTASSDDA